jgi:hypothetical protein
VSSVIGEKYDECLGVNGSVYTFRIEMASCTARQYVMDQEMELAKAIKEGTLELICPEMELLVCPSYHESALKGTGVIRSNDLGRIYFRMISPFSVGGTRHRSLFGSKLVGELYAPEDYVMLRAVDEYGREWRSNQLRVDLTRQIPDPNYHIRSYLSSIVFSHERKTIDQSLVRILIPGVPELPFDGITQERRIVDGRDIGFSSSVNRHEHRIGDATVIFRREDDAFVSVSAFQDEALMPTWPGLICNALGFATAQTISPAVVAREFKDRKNLSLHSGPFWRYSSVLHSPVPFTDRRGTADFWRLVELFFAYIEKQQIESKPLLDELDSIRRGAQGFFQTACLTLAVGIESIARLLLKDGFSPLISRPSIQPLLEHIDSWQGDVALKGRAKGALSRLTNIGAADLMYEWAKKTGTNEDMVDSWKKLRHPKAHGEKLTEESGWTLYCGVAELLYRMVAYAVGYSGPILETSQPGWGLQ